MPTNNDTTTSFKVDISQLKKAMQDAKRAVSVANSEFKAAAAACDDWTQSSDGLSAKLKQLDSNLKNQKTILSSLEAQYEAVVAEQGEGSAAADRLKIAINNQRATISNTEKEIVKYKESLQEVQGAEERAAKSGKSVAEELENVGDKAEDAGDGFTTLKGAMATFAGNMLTSFVGAIKEGIGAIIGLADETREYRTEMGKLETAFTTAGFTAETASDTYQDLYAVLGDEGQAVEAANHLAQLADSQSELSQWTNIATGVYATFGDSLPIEGLAEAANETAKTGAITGNLADALNWAGVSEDEFQASLDACNTEQERQALIASTLNSLYSEAASTYREVNGEIMDAQRAQSELTDATAELGAVAEPVMTSFKLMGAALLTELLPAVSEIGQGFTDLINGVDGAEESIGAGLGSLLDTVLNKVTEVLPSLVTVAFTLITTLANAILEALPDLVTTLVQVVTELIAGLSTALPELVTAIIEIVPDIIDALMEQLPVFIQACVDFLSAMVQALPTVIQALVTALPQLITSIVNGLLAGINTLVQGAITLLMAIVDAIPLILPVLITALPQIINTIVTGLITYLPQLLEAGITLLMAIIDAIPQIITPLMEALPQIIETITSTLLDNLPLLLDTAVELLMALVTAIPEIVTALGQALPQIVSTIISVIRTLLPQLANFVGQLFSNIATWFVQVINNGRTGARDFVNTIINWVKLLPSRIWTWLTNAVSKVVSFGADLLEKGTEAATGLFDTIVDTVGGIPEEMLSIGENIVEGLWNGISAGWDWLTDSVADLANSLLESAQEALGIASPSKAFRDEVGKWIPEGIAVGIDRNAKSVVDSVKNLTANALGGLSVNATGASGGVGATGGGVVNNFYQTNNSPKALSRLEIYRQTTNLLGYATGGA